MTKKVQQACVDVEDNIMARSRAKFEFSYHTVLPMPLPNTVLS